MPVIATYFLKFLTHFFMRLEHSMTRTISPKKKVSSKVDPLLDDKNTKRETTKRKEIYCRQSIISNGNMMIW